MNDISHRRTVELSVKFLTNMGVSTDNVKYFEQFINPKKLPEGCKDHEEFCNLLAHQKWVKYFENSKDFPVFLRNPFTQCRNWTNFLTYPSAVDKRIKQSWYWICQKAFWFCSMFTSIFHARNSMATSTTISNFWRKICTSTARLGTSLKMSWVLDNEGGLKSYLCILKWVY